LVRTRGSHKQFKHPTKPGLVTLPVHPGKTLGINTVKSIERQSGIKF
jgi:predicted RNA binding protein YcfA (HicA-like mRNA interferase family)